MAGRAAERRTPDELRSIMTAAENLPPRSYARPEHDRHDAAREKEIVKRRLAALVEPRATGSSSRSPGRWTAFNGIAGDSRAASIGSIALLNEQSYRLAALARRVRGNQLPAFLRRQPARRRCEWKTRRSSTRCTGSCLELVARGARDRAAGRSRRRPVRARRLPAAAAGAVRPTPRRADAADARSIVVVEKILGPDEQLPADWPVHGTTGYEFAARRQQPVRGRPQRARARRHLPRGSSRERRDAAVVRRSRLPQQEAGHARDDVGRHQLARPSAESVLGAQPALPRLHALQPDLDASRK